MSSITDVGIMAAEHHAKMVAVNLTQFPKEVDLCKQICNMILDNWDKLENTTDTTVCLDGSIYKIHNKATCKIDVTDGLCRNTMLNSIFYWRLSKAIFESWDSVECREYSNLPNTVFPVGGSDEWKLFPNKFKNPKRKELLIHIIKCLDEIELHIGKSKCY